ncbi:MAG: helix-turn-helix transcriptional regulator [Candidatus Parabeggiatoa sp.]|nr:helix-turn-helix transcriptional regulator [Candidatus Parabeggiatoa sp.]
MTIGERLKKAIKNKGLKLTEFAKQSKVPYRTLQGYIANEIIPGGESLVKIHAELGVSIDWLLTGQKEMYDKKATKNVSTLVGTIEWLNEWWDRADEKHRHWLEVQMKRCFPEYAKWADKE